MLSKLMVIKIEIALSKSPHTEHELRNKSSSTYNLRGFKWFQLPASSFILYYPPFHIKTDSLYICQFPFICLPDIWLEMRSSFLVRM